PQPPSQWPSPPPHAPALPVGTKRAHDRRLVLLAAASLAVSVVGVVLRALHLLPSSAATGIGFAAAAIALRILMVFAARSASDAHRAKVLNRVSLAGLAVSGAVLAVALPRITKASGMGTFFGDVVAVGWTLALTMVATGTVRTLTWRVYLGAGLTGLLAVSALVRLVDVPLYHHFGPDSQLENAVIGPAIEEVFKALLLVLIVWLAARRRDVRPSALDLMLLGMWVGAGYELYEDAMYGRGGTHFGSVPVLSLVFPAMIKSDALSVVATGHLMYTGVVGLGLGVGVLYRRRWRFAWLAAPAGFFFGFAEHAGFNAVVVSGGGEKPWWASLLFDVSLSGYLSSLLLIGGGTGLVLYEWRRATKARLDPASAAPGCVASWKGSQGQAVAVPRWLWVTQVESGRRSARLAGLQCQAPRTGVPQVLAPPPQVFTPPPQMSQVPQVPQSVPVAGGWS
ncbi:PrsW family glutamic-type intramembrane protease, partial [Catenulispora rubra]|uniref:PrsW family glutamic-type intramembrane protease n=1 Tax=Catenulispora rubra TaxID=280293 RepID=UPI001E653AC3